MKEENIQGAIDHQVNNLYPSREFMIVIPLIIGVGEPSRIKGYYVSFLFLTFVAAAAFFVSAFLAVSYMPSVATTVLQLRSGVIATFRDEGFDRYRTTPDKVMLLTGDLFLGSFIASVTVGGFVGLLVSFFLVTLSLR